MSPISAQHRVRLFFTAVNFAITLSIWDYMFGTAYIPNSGRDEILGFENDEEFPKTFWETIQTVSFVNTI